MPKSNTLLIDGIEKTVSQWARDAGLPTRVIRERLELGWSGAELLKPTRNHSFHYASKGGKRTPEFSSYSAILTRCTNPRSKDWPKYGGDGITICDRWRYGENGIGGFECFLKDMGARTDKSMSVDRIDNSKGYSPQNCRWASVKEQAINRKTTRLLKHNGEVRTLTDWARHVGLSQPLLHARLESGWTVDDALTTPARKYKLP